MSAIRYTAIIDQIDALLSLPPSIERAQALVDLAGDDQALNRYLFSQIEDPSWLPSLIAVDSFSTPADPITEIDAKGQQFSTFPPWPPIWYLKRIASAVPMQVAIIIADLPRTDNYGVHHDLLEVLLAMPVEVAALLADEARKWVETGYSVGLFARDLAKLIVRFIEGGFNEEALTLTKSILAVLPDPSDNRENEGRFSHQFTPEPRGRIDSFEYEEVIQAVRVPLTDKLRHSAIALFCDLLDDAVRLSRHEKENYSDVSSGWVEEYSYIWRPSIEEDKQNFAHGMKDVLISAVRDAAQQLAEPDSTLVPILIDLFDSHRWRVFDRLGLNLLALFPNASPENTTKKLVDRERFESYSVRHEYARLLRNGYRYLDSRERGVLLEWVEEGPNRSDLRRRLVEVGGVGADATDDLIEEYVRNWKFRQLTLFPEELLTERLRGDLGRLKEEFGPLEHPDFPVFHSEWLWGPTSPKTIEDMAMMSPTEIATYLREWEPPTEQGASNDEMLPTPEGLGRTLADAVKSNPEPFAIDAMAFTQVEATYVHAILRGLRDARKDRRQFPWDAVIKLCRWVSEQPHILVSDESITPDRDPDWGGARGAVAGLFSEGFGGLSEGIIPFELNREVWSALEPLTEDPEPTLEYENERGGGFMNLATLSLNVVRGEAMHAVIRYALWYQHSVPTSDLSNGLSNVRKVLERHLNPEVEPSRAVRAVYGQWFPWLVRLDRTWAKANVARIFPPEEAVESLRDAAWETYLRFCHAYPEVYELLRDEYYRAVNDLEGEPMTDTAKAAHDMDEQPLAAHLMQLYWRGALLLTDPEGILPLFYRNSSDTLRAEAVRIIAPVLNQDGANARPEFVERIQALWHYRLDDMAHAQSPTEYVAESSSLVEWFASKLFPDEWAVMTLRQTLGFCVLAATASPKQRHRTFAEGRVIEKLVTMAQSYPDAVINCLALMVELDTEGWQTRTWQDELSIAIEIVQQSQNSDAVENAAELADRLVGRGLYEFRRYVVTETKSPPIPTTITSG